jgi:hypothetical protein
MSAQVSVGDEVRTGEIECRSHCLGQVERRVTGVVSTDDALAEPGRHLSQIRTREAVGVWSDTGPEGGPHLARPEGPHGRHRFLYDPRHEAPPTGVDGGDDAFRAGQAERGAVRCPHYEGGAGTSGYRGVGLLRPPGPRAVDDDHPVTVHLMEPGPRGVGQRSLATNCAGHQGVGEIAAPTAAGTHLTTPGQLGQPGAGRKGASQASCLRQATPAVRRVPAGTT